MAANIEQIFQDFILNKIKEIEDLNEDKTAVGGVDSIDEMIARQNSTSDRSRHEDLGSQKKKHKKHKKHKSKKKKKNREKEQKESSSESGDESDHGTKQQLRGERPEVNKEQGEKKSSCHKRQGKKKKKKRKRDEEGSSSASDSEIICKRDSKYGPSELPRRQEDLPDIIPKQDSSSKSRDQDQLSRRSSCSRSPSHSCSHSHSCSLRRNCHCKTRRNRRSRTWSTSSPHRHRTRSRSQEKNQVVDESVEFIQTNRQCSPIGQTIKAERVNYSNTEKKEEPTEQMGSVASQSTMSKSICSETDPRADAIPPKLNASGSRQSSSSPSVTSPTKQKRKTSNSSQRRKEHKSSKRTKRSRTPCRSRRRGSRSRSPLRKKRSRSRSEGRRSRRSRSRSASLGRKRNKYSQRDRWKREPSHSPVLILRKNRSPTWKHCSSTSSPQRISELDKEQLLEIAKANAAAMCAKAGMPIPASLRSSVLPLALPTMAMNAAMASMTAATVTAALSNIGTLSSLLPLPSITNKPPSAPAQTSAALEDVKKKVEKQANSISIKEFTDKCRMIVDSKGELPVAVPHVSDEEDDGKPFGGSALREQKAISFSINNLAVRPVVRSDAGMAKEFPVSSGSQHRKKEGEVLGAYGEWVPIGKTADKAPCSSRKAPPTAPVASANSVPGETEPAAPPVTPMEQPVFGSNIDSVFPDPPVQHVDISQAVTERIRAQRRLAENPYDVSAICMLSRAQEQVDAWAQSNTVPGLFTGSTGAQVLSSEELSMSGPQAWLKKDQFLRAAPVSGGVGEFLMRKMGWRTGEGLGRNREGTVEPIIIDFKVDRKGLVAEGEKPQKQTGGLVVTKDLMGKHPVSALIELCNKRRIMQPDFVMVHHSGPDHRKNFLFKVTVNGVDYQPQTASPNKKHAKAMAATVALQALGEVPVDGPGLYTGPVFTAASTGPLFST